MSRDCKEVGDCAKVGLLERRDEAVIPRNARSMPAENAFSRAEETTMTRTVGSSAIRSNAAPYSRQYLFSCNRVVSTKDLASERRSAAALRPAEVAYSPFMAFTRGLLWGSTAIRTNGWCGNGRQDLTYLVLRVVHCRRGSLG